MARTVSEDVLISEFEARACRGLGNARRIIENQSSSAGGLGDFSEPLPSEAFFEFRSEQQRRRVTYVDGVNLRVGFAG